MSDTFYYFKALVILHRRQRAFLNISYLNKVFALKQI